VNHQPDLTQLLQPLEADLVEVAALQRMLADQVREPLKGMLHHALGGGKNVRPALVLLVGRMFARPVGPFYTLAAATEILHSATLVHDDLIDGASLRRGRPTLHSEWPLGSAVLAGDYLLALSTRLIAQMDRPRLVATLSRTLQTICEGEIYQTLVTLGAHRDLESYLQTIGAKSAALFSGAMEMAGHLAGATTHRVLALSGYGRELGLAFQMMDDLLDFTGDEREMGKPVGSDLQNGIVTLPVLRYLELGVANDPVTPVLAGRRDADSVRAAVRAVLHSPAVDRSIADARQHAEAAQELLLSLPACPERETLHDIASFVVGRRR